MGPILREFPFSDADIIAGKLTVGKIPAHYREVYGPAAGSPLLGAGDSADRKAAYIGAVDGGKETPNDYFGMGESVASK